jgi:hypothetical protein
MVGEIRKPNALQKLLHSFFMLRPVTAFFAPWVHRLDNSILSRTTEKFSAVQILGWPVIQLTTIGAKTKQRAAHRHIPVMVLEPKK